MASHACALKHTNTSRGCEVSLFCLTVIECQLAEVIWPRNGSVFEPLANKHGYFTANWNFILIQPELQHALLERLGGETIGLAWDCILWLFP